SVWAQSGGDVPKAVKRRPKIKPLSLGSIYAASMSSGTRCPGETYEKPTTRKSLVMATLATFSQDEVVFFIVQIQDHNNPVPSRIRLAGSGTAVGADVAVSTTESTPAFKKLPEEGNNDAVTEGTAKKVLPLDKARFVSLKVAEKVAERKRVVSGNWRA